MVAGWVVRPGQARRQVGGWGGGRLICRPVQTLPWPVSQPSSQSSHYTSMARPGLIPLIIRHDSAMSTVLPFCHFHSFFLSLFAPLFLSLLYPFAVSHPLSLFLFLSFSFFFLSSRYIYVYVFTVPFLSFLLLLRLPVYVCVCCMYVRLMCVYILELICVGFLRLVLFELKSFP